MEFELFKTRVDRVIWETGFELSRCEDMYRLYYLLSTFQGKLKDIAQEVNLSLQELEEYE